MRNLIVEMVLLVGKPLSSERGLIDKGQGLGLVEQRGFALLVSLVNVADLSCGQAYELPSSEISLL
jgi:hypothetical protein